MNVIHEQVESAFFEFNKMKSFLESGVTKAISNIPVVPIKEAQQYVNSLLIVDLISVFDQAVDYMFALKGFKQQRRKSKLKVLDENGCLIKPDYLSWYKQLRHETAHNMAKHEFHHLRQATHDIAWQLGEWGIKSAALSYWPYETNAENGVAKTGSLIDLNGKFIVILEFVVRSTTRDSGSSQKTIDLSWQEFKALHNP